MGSVDKEKNFVVCNLGSTYISGMVARKLSNGCITPLAIEREPSSDAIVHGCIHNIDNSVEIIKRILVSLERQLPEEGEIEKIYVGIDCRSMHTRTCEVSLDLGDEGQIVTPEHLNSLRRQIDNVSFEGYSIVMVVDPKFFADGKREINPKGVKCSHLKAKYQVVLVRKNIIDNIYHTIEDRLHKNIAGILINPIAEAHVSLTSEDFTLGCAYINIGGGTTSVAIFRERLLSAMYVIPVGGINVTKDLMSLKLLKADAEKLKVSKASMDTSMDKDATINFVSQNTMGKKTLFQLEVNSTVASRMNEITLNIFSLIKELGYEDDLAGGIVISGGASKLKGYDDYLRNIGAEYRYASIKGGLIDECVEEKSMSDDITLIGLVAMATENCIHYYPKTIDDIFEQDVEDDQIDEDTVSDTIYTHDPSQNEEVDEDWTVEDDYEEDSDNIDNTSSKENHKEKTGWFRKMFEKGFKLFEGQEDNM